MVIFTEVLDFVLESNIDEIDQTDQMNQIDQCAVP